MSTPIKKVLHVLIIPSWYPEYEGDYVGSFFREQALALAKRDCKVGIIFPQLKSLRGLKKVRLFFKYDYQLDEILPTHRILWSNWFIKMRKVQIKVFTFLGIYLFKKYVKKHGIPDIIHCHSIFNAGYLGERISKKYNIPFLLTEHNSGFYYKNQGLQKYYQDVVRITNSAKLCLTVSSEYAKFLQNEIPNNIKWKTHNNLVADLFLNRKILNDNINEFVFVSISRLQEIKNIQLQIKAFKLLSDDLKNIKLKIIGTGNERKKLEDLVNKLGLNNQVYFLGKQSRKDIVKHLNQSNVLIHTSKFETFGVIFVEALAMGKPVITTDCGGSSDVINDTVGIITPQEDISELYKNMKKIYLEIDNYPPETLRNYCKNNFSEEILSHKLLKHFEKILKFE